MPQLQTACQYFQNQFAQLLAQVPALDDNFIKFVSVTNKTNLEDLQKGVDNYRKAQGEFATQFQERVKEMLSNWFWDVGLKSDHYLKFVEFENSQRVAIQEDLQINTLWSVDTEEGVKYFPSIIRKITGSLEIEGANNINTIDFLEEVGFSLKIARQQTLGSFRRLKKIGGSLGIAGSKHIDLPSLEQVGGVIQLNGLTQVFGGLPKLKEIGSVLLIHGTRIENIRRAFPVLSRIGKDGGGISVYCDNEQHFNQFDNLRRVGEIAFDGRVSYS